MHCIDKSSIVTVESRKRDISWKIWCNWSHCFHFPSRRL